MKICIVANYAYGALTGEESGHIGGVERQTALLSEWLSKRGHKVTVITWDEGGAPIEYINKIKIIKLCKVSDGLPFLRFFTPRWTSLISALKTADADIYYHNCAEYITGQVSLWCQLNKKPFIYTIASDADCEINLPKLKTKRDRVLFLYGLRNANEIICQTNKQKQMLLSNHNLPSKVIAMPGTPAIGTPNKEHQFKKQKVIWVGRIQSVKRLEWLIDIALQLPEVNFEVVGPYNHNYEYTRDLLPRIDKLNNVKLLGKIARKNMPDVYKNATILLNTSIYEGFPNTYIEAWNYGVPTVCSIDPDNVINNFNLGYSSKEQSDLTKAIKDLLSNKNKWKKCSSNSIKYSQTHHSINMIQEKFEKEFLAFSYTIKTQNYFNLQSKKWSKYYSNKSNSISHIDIQTRVNYATNYLPIPSSNNNILIDVGCGTGNGTNAFHNKMQCVAYGIDFAEEMVIESKQNYGKNITFQVANATNLPFNNQFASHLVSLGTLEYIPQYKDALNEFCRVLKNNGQLILSVPNKHSLFRKLRVFGKKITRPIKKIRNKKQYEQEYHKLWTQKRLSKELNDSGFYIIDITYFTYGFLNPKLVHNKANIKLCYFLNKHLAKTNILTKYLAHSIIVCAKKIDY